MKNQLPLNPVHDLQALDAAEVLNVVCHHCETCNFSGTANEEVVILYGCKDQGPLIVFLEKRSMTCPPDRVIGAGYRKAPNREMPFALENLHFNCFFVYLKISFYVKG